MHFKHSIILNIDINLTARKKSIMIVSAAFIVSIDIKITASFYSLLKIASMKKWQCANVKEYSCILWTGD